MTTTMIDGGDSFKPRKSSGITEEQNLAQATEWLSLFINGVLSEK